MNSKSNARPSALLPFTWGVHFSALQFSYFFILEAYVSSQVFCYFLILITWIFGALIGTWSPNRAKSFITVTAISCLIYYLAYLAVRAFPFHDAIILCVMACSILSGYGAGLFFPRFESLFQSPKLLLFHENNGFLLGILISLVCSVVAAEWFLKIAVIFTFGAAYYSHLCTSKMPAESHTSA